MSRYPKGSFVVVPVRAIYDERLTHIALRVLGVLQDHANGHDDLTFPGVETMAEDLGVDARQVRRALRRLEATGYVETQARTKPGRGKTTNHYRVLFGREDTGVRAGGREDTGVRGPTGQFEQADRTIEGGPTGLQCPVIEVDPGEVDPGEADATRARAREDAAAASDHCIEIDPAHEALARCLEAVAEREQAGDPDEDDADKAICMLATEFQALADTIARQIEAHLLAQPAWHGRDVDDLGGIVAYQLGVLGSLASSLVARTTRQREHVEPALRLCARCFVDPEQASADDFALWWQLAEDAGLGLFSSEAINCVLVCGVANAHAANGHDKRSDLEKRPTLERWLSSTAGRPVDHIIDAWVHDLTTRFCDETPIQTLINIAQAEPHLSDFAALSSIDNWVKQLVLMAEQPNVRGGV